MIRFLFWLIVLFSLSVSEAEAVYRFVSLAGGAGAGCSSTSQNVTGVDPGNYQTWAQVVICAVAGDTIRLKGANYGTLGLGLGANTETFATGQVPGGASAGSPTIIENVPGETVTVRAIVVHAAATHFVIRSSTAWNFIVDSNNWANVSCIQGSNTTGTIIFQNLFVTRCSEHGILGSFNNAQYLNIKAQWIGRLTNGTPVCDVGGGVGMDRVHCHVFYAGGNNITVNGGDWSQVQGTGVHSPCTAGGMTNSTVKNIKIKQFTGFGIIIGCGSGNSIFNNEITNGEVISGGFSAGGIQFGFGAMTVYSNTIYSMGSGGDAINFVGTTAGSFIRNNLMIQTGGITIRDGGTFTQSNNVTTGAASAIFADAANADFRLCTAAGVPNPSCPGAATTAIDQGFTLGVPWNVDIVGTARPPGAYDIGAYEAGTTPAGKPTPIELVGRYSCDNTANDTSTFANHGKLVGGATYDASGKYNQACSFNGTTAYIEIPDSNSLDMETGFSILAWVKPNSAAFSYIVNKTNSPTAGSYWLATSTSLCAPGGPFVGYEQPSGTTINACWGTPLTTGTWTHLAGTYEAQGDPNIKLFQNTTQVTQFSGSATLSVGSGVVRIGSGNGDGFFNGLVDEVWILKGAIPATNVASPAIDGECTTAWSAANYTITRIRNCPINTLTPTSPVGIKVGGAATLKTGGSGFIKSGSTSEATVLLDSGGNLVLDSGGNIILTTP